MRLRETEWVDVDIADEMLMPARVCYETRIVNGRRQIRNPGIVPFVSEEYLQLVLSEGSRE